MPLMSLRFKGISQLENAQSNSPAIVRGAVGDGVRAIQQALQDLGYSLKESFGAYGAPDGIFGKETKSRLIEFQIKSALEPDGKAGMNTVNKLDEQFKSENIPPPVVPIPNIEYQVPRRVRLTNQRHWFGGDSLCWAAALTMMFEWRDQKEHSTRDLLDSIGWKFRILFETNCMLQKSLWYELLRGAGMTGLESSSMTPRDWEHLLRTHGLLWVGAMSSPDSYAYGHSFIMRGLTISPTGDQHVMVINPYGAREENPSFERFNQMYDNASTSGFPQIRYFAFGR